MYVKWPNDIYYQSQVKLGGVLVTTYSSGSSSTPTTAIIGEKKRDLRMGLICTSYSRF